VEGHVIHKKALLSYNLGKVEDEKHLLLACPNTQKIKERFCSTMPLTHIIILVELM
jgi:hypothetical protein